MSHPLPVAGLRGRSDGASVDVRKTQGETRIPTTPTLGVIPGYVTDVFYRGAEACGADHGAVGASQAALTDVIPAGMLKVLVEKIFDPVGVDAPRLLVRSFANPGFHLLNILFADWRYFHLRQYLGPAVAAGLHKKAVSLFSVQFCEGQIESPGNARPGSHRRAETSWCSPRALHGDDEFAGAALFVCWIAELIVEQNAVLHRDGRQFAGSNSQKCERAMGSRFIIQNSERFPLALGEAEPHIRRVEIFFPALWSHRIAKEGLIPAPLKPVVSRFLLVGPAGRQLFGKCNAVVYDRPVPHSRRHYFVTPVEQHLDQRSQLVCLQSYKLRGRHVVTPFLFQP